MKTLFMFVGVFLQTASGSAADFSVADLVSQRNERASATQFQVVIRDEMQFLVPMSSQAVAEYMVARDGDDLTYRHEDVSRTDGKWFMDIRADGKRATVSRSRRHRITVTHNTNRKNYLVGLDQQCTIYFEAVNAEKSLKRLRPADLVFNPAFLPELITMEEIHSGVLNLSPEVPSLWFGSFVLKAGHRVEIEARFAVNDETFLQRMEYRLIKTVDNQPKVMRRLTRSVDEVTVNDAGFLFPARVTISETMDGKEMFSLVRTYIDVKTGPISNNVFEVAHYTSSAGGPVIEKEAVDTAADFEMLVKGEVPQHIQEKLERSPSLLREKGSQRRLALIAVNLLALAIAAAFYIWKKRRIANR